MSVPYIQSVTIETGDQPDDGALYSRTDLTGAAGFNAQSCQHHSWSWMNITGISASLEYVEMSHK